MIEDKITGSRQHHLFRALIDPSMTEIPNTAFTDCIVRSFLLHECVLVKLVELKFSWSQPSHTHIFEVLYFKTVSTQLPRTERWPAGKPYLFRRLRLLWVLLRFRGDLVIPRHVRTVGSSCFNSCTHFCNKGSVPAASYCETWRIFLLRVVPNSGPRDYQKLIHNSAGFFR